MEKETRKFIDQLNLDLSDLSEAEKVIAIAEALVDDPEYGKYILVYTQDIAEYLNWPKDKQYSFRVFPGTSISWSQMIFDLSVWSDKFTLNGEIIWSMERRRSEWAQMEESSGHKRFSPPDFGYSSWSCSWCGAHFIGDVPEDVPNPKDIKCEKDIHMAKPPIIDMHGFVPEDWK